MMMMMMMMMIRFFKIDTINKLYYILINYATIYVNIYIIMYTINIFIIIIRIIRNSWILQYQFSINIDIDEISFFVLKKNHIQCWYLWFYFQRRFSASPNWSRRSFHQLSRDSEASEAMPLLASLESRPSPMCRSAHRVMVLSCSSPHWSWRSFHQLSRDS